VGRAHHGYPTTYPLSYDISPHVLGPLASLIGSEFPLPGLRPSLCPGPMRQGVSYVQISVVYIRNTLPDDMSVPSSASLAYQGGAKRYSLKCVEGEFSEVRIQHPA
jgi:hypothetical protein